MSNENIDIFADNSGKSFVGYRCASSWGWGRTVCIDDLAKSPRMKIAPYELSHFSTIELAYENAEHARDPHHKPKYAVCVQSYGTIWCVAVFDTKKEAEQLKHSFLPHPSGAVDAIGFASAKGDTQ